REVPVRSQARRRVERAPPRLEVRALRRREPPRGADLEPQIQALVGERLTARGASRRDRFPPEETGPGLELDPGLLPVTRPGKRDQRVRQELEQPALLDARDACFDRRRGRP